MAPKDNQPKDEERLLTYKEYVAYINNKARRLDLNQLLKNALTNTNIK